MKYNLMILNSLMVHKIKKTLAIKGHLLII